MSRPGGLESLPTQKWICPMGAEEMVGESSRGFLRKDKKVNRNK